MTTNESDPLLKLSDVSDLKAIERRFVTASVSELEKPPKIERLCTVNRSTSDDIIIEILKRLNSKLHTTECHPSLEDARRYISSFAQAILLETEKDGDGNGWRDHYIEVGSVPHRVAPPQKENPPNIEKQHKRAKSDRGHSPLLQNLTNRGSNPAAKRKLETATTETGDNVVLSEK